jgi:hypothetical protein
MEDSMCWERAEQSLNSSLSDEIDPLAARLGDSP